MSESRPLVYNRLYVINKSKDGSTSFTIGVYEGTASINVFTISEEAKKPAVKINIPQDGIAKLIYLAKKCLNASPESTFTISTNRYNMETKKAEPTGDITMGRDASRTPFIAINSAGISPQVYYIRSSLAWEMTSPDADENNIIALNTFIDVLDRDVRIAKLNTSFRRQQPNGQSQQGGVRTSDTSSQGMANKDHIPF